jgi:microcystin-dependent protein
MSDQYVGEIRMFGGNYAPSGWHLCDGSTLTISENEVLFTLIGTTYGGDGVTTFKLPDLRGRIPVHISGSNPSIPLGQQAGTENVTLILNQLPAHTHTANANNVPTAATDNSPTNNLWGVSSGVTNYTNQPPDVTMYGSSLSVVGGNQPHENMMPSLAINFIIALVGLFPTQS